jgi:hypothetical protein
MSGGVGAGRVILPATRLGSAFISKNPTLCQAIKSISDEFKSCSHAGRKLVPRAPIRLNGPDNKPNDICRPWVYRRPLLPIPSLPMAVDPSEYVANSNRRLTNATGDQHTFALGRETLNCELDAPIHGKCVEQPNCDYATPVAYQCQDSSRPFVLSGSLSASAHLNLKLPVRILQVQNWVSSILSTWTTPEVVRARFFERKYSLFDGADSMRAFAAE